MTCGECGNYIRDTELVDGRGRRTATSSAYIMRVDAAKELACGKREPREESDIVSRHRAELTD